MENPELGAINNTYVWHFRQKLLGNSRYTQHAEHQADEQSCLARTSWCIHCRLTRPFQRIPANMCINLMLSEIIIPAEHFCRWSYTTIFVRFHANVSESTDGSINIPARKQSLTYIKWPTAPLVTELLQLPVPGYGTAYRHISEMLTYRTVDSGGH